MQALSSIGILLMAGAMGCAQASQPPTHGGPRFRDTNVILVDADSVARIPIRGLGYGEFPRGSTPGWADVDVPIAFVIDTAGRVERTTISFLEPVPAKEFRVSVCDRLRRVGFGPPVLDGRRRRVLVTQLHSYRSGPVHSSPSRQIGEFWARYRGLARADLFEKLESLPHC